MIINYMTIEKSLKKKQTFKRMVMFVSKAHAW